MPRPQLASRRPPAPSEAQRALARLSTRDEGRDGFARRRFLQGMLATGGSVGLVPGVFDSIAAAATPLGPNDRILVTVFLNGGNDHLNTLVPAESGPYRSLRGSLAVSVDGSTAVGGGLHLNPALRRLKNRFDSGQVALIRGVGEPALDHSHFSSTATWFAGRAGQVNPTGWLGRYADGLDLGSLGMVSIGWGGVPMLLRGVHARAIGLPPSGALFGADRAEDWQRFAVEALSDFGGGGVGGPFGDVVGRSLRDAVDVAASIQPAYTEGLPDEGLARELGLAAQVVNLDLGTRLISVSLDGFDHHEGQRPSHDQLLAELDLAIHTFFSSLAPSFAGRTAMLVFSEFGRRVEANDSLGTDHGTAGLMMFISARAAGGLHGKQPSLTDLDWHGDLKHHVDFRRVYATILEDWLDGDARGVLGASYSKLELVEKGGTSSFSDVPANTYYSAAVAWLAATGITTGTSPGHFSPNDLVTRGQMATFLHRYRGSPTGAPRARFVDVPAGKYYTAAVDWLFAEGITTGTSPGRFSPDDIVTRGQMATFLHRLEGTPGGAPPAGFADVKAGAYYAKAVDWLLYRGITTGVGGNRFAPDDPVSRAQMATFLWRLAGSPV
ncbi:MAG: S-layer homology domain-containing protein [Acidimicrobiales bacterium]